MSDAPPTSGPLLIQNAFSEIAEEGSDAQAIAREHLGLGGIPVTIPDATILGFADGAFVGQAIDDTLLTNGAVISVNVALVNASAPVQSVAGRTGTITLSAADISGLAPSATVNTTNASNITAGSLAAARLAAGAAVANLGYAPLNPIFNLSDVVSVPTAQANLGAGAANGLATLDGGGHLTIAQLPPGIGTGFTPLGAWNASTNAPTLVSSVGTNGTYYQVSVAGTTTLNGISTWGVGDWAQFIGGAWQRIPYSTTFGTMAVQNASGVAITGGSIAGQIAVGLADGSVIGQSSNVPGDFSFLDRFGGVLSYYSTASAAFIDFAPTVAPSITANTANITTSVNFAGGPTVGQAIGMADDFYLLDAFGGALWKLSAALQSWVTVYPINTPSVTTGTLIVATLAPDSISFVLNSAPDSSIFPASVPSIPTMAVGFLDRFDGLLNYIDASTGELAHQTATSVPPDLVAAEVPTGLINAGHLKTRLTHAPATVTALTNGASGTTYAAIYTAEALGSLWRFMLVSDVASNPPTVEVIFAFSDVVNDGINPLINGQPSPWIRATFLNAGLPVDYQTQYANLVTANFVAPTSLRLPVIVTPGVPVFSLTDWVEGVSVMRTDGGLGASLVFVRVYVSSGVPSYPFRAGDIGGAWDGDLNGRTMQFYDQAVNGVDTPSAFTSTTRSGTPVCIGMQYESLARGVQMMVFGDSVWAGFGSNQGIQYSQRILAMALSTPDLPVEVANFAQTGAAPEWSFIWGTQAMVWVQPSWLHSQLWSANIWAETQYGCAVSSIQTQIGGTITNGDSITLTITDSLVPGLPVALTYNITGADTDATVAAGLVALVNANSTLTGAGFSARANGVWCNVLTPGALQVATGAITTSVGATITGTVYNDFGIFTDAAANQALAMNFAVADWCQAHNCVYIVANAYPNARMNPQSDPTRVRVNTILAGAQNIIISNVNALLGISGGGAGGVPSMNPADTADQVHPNPTGQVLIANLEQPLLEAAFNIS